MAVNIFGMNQPTPAFQSFMGGMDAVAGYRLKNAQAQREQALAQMPFGGQTLPGPAGQVQGIEMIGKMYGYDSPQYQNAMKAFNSGVGLQSAKSNYFNANVNLKNLPNDTKQAIIAQGFPIAGASAPTAMADQNNKTPLPLTPDQQNSVVVSQQSAGIDPNTQLAATNTSTDSGNLNNPTVQKEAAMTVNKKIAGGKITDRYQAGIALENLVNSPEAQGSFKTLANYSGIEGAAKAKYQSFFNPPAYLQYKSATNQFNNLVSGSLKVLEGYPSTDQGISNAKGYFQDAQAILPTNPKAAMDYFNKGRALLTAETGALKGAAEPVFPVNDPRFSGSSANNATKSTDTGVIRVTAPDGTKGTIPAKNLQAALKAGYKQVQ